MALEWLVRRGFDSLSGWFSCFGRDGVAYIQVVAKMLCVVQLEAPLGAVNERGAHDAVKLTKGMWKG